MSLPLRPESHRSAGSRTSPGTASGPAASRRRQAAASSPTRPEKRRSHEAPPGRGRLVIDPSTSSAYSRRMPRMQVYLPDELYRAVKEQGLAASELLQEAVRAELRRRRLLDETERYVAELAAEVGEPS